MTGTPAGGAVGGEDRAALDLLASWNDKEEGDDEPASAPSDDQERTQGTTSVVQNLTRGRRGTDREGYYGSSLKKQQSRFFVTTTIMVYKPVDLFFIGTKKNYGQFFYGQFFLIS